MSSAGDFRRFGEPSPREEELPFQSYEFAAKERRLLPIPDPILRSACLEVLHKRESRRQFGRLSDRQLSALLWFSAKTLRTRREPSGFPWQHRPSPSGGGRHPIHILVLGPTLDPGVVSVYEPEGHALLVLDLLEQTAAEDLASELELVFPPQLGTVLYFAAEPGRTSSRYKDCESLVWRDAGALSATIAIAAEALSLNCCAFGPLFDLWISRVLPGSPFVGAGGIVVGAR